MHVHILSVQTLIKHEFQISMQKIDVVKQFFFIHSKSHLCNNYTQYGFFENTCRIPFNFLPIYINFCFLSKNQKKIKNLTLFRFPDLLNLFLNLFNMVSAFSLSDSLYSSQTLINIQFTNFPSFPSFYTGKNLKFIKVIEFKFRKCSKQQI